MGVPPVHDGPPIHLRTGRRELRRLAGAVLGEYALRPSRVRLLTNHEHAVFRVEAETETETEDGTTSGRFGLRLYDPTVFDAPSVTTELEWLAALGRDWQDRVPRPVANRGGSLLTPVSGDLGPPRYGAVFRWVEGRRRRATLTPSAMRLVGEFIARLHCHAAGFVPSIGRTGQRWDWDRVFGHGSLVGPDATDALLSGEEHAVVRGTALRLRETMDRLGASPDRWGLIHADLHSSNYLFHGAEVRAIDFEDCGWGYYLYDLAVVLDDVHATYPERADEFLAALLEGYRQVRRLSTGEESLLDLFVAMRLAELVRWYGSSMEPTPREVARKLVGEAVGWMQRHDPSSARRWPDPV